jgi:hypothetical protein
VSGRRVLQAAAVVATLVVGQLITDHWGLVSHDDPPFLHHGAVGRAVHLSYGDVEVTDVRPAQHLAPRDSSQLARIAGGVFVLVTAKLTASREPTMFLTVRLVGSDGRLYLASTRSTCTPHADSDTGIATYALFCFDVPTAALAGLHFQTARGSPLGNDIDGDDLADIDLGISAADAKAWARTTETYLVEPADITPFQLRTVTLQESS